MPRLYFCLRLLAIAVAFPAILVYILLATLAHPVAAVRFRFRVPLRIWMKELWIGLREFRWATSWWGALRGAFDARRDRRSS